MSKHSETRLGYCTGFPPKKKTLIRCDTPLTKRVTSFQRIDAEGNDVLILNDKEKPANEGIEFLANGQYAVISGIYPGKDLRYQWDGNTPATVPFSKVLCITLEDLLQLSDAMTTAVLATGHYRLKASTTHRTVLAARSKNVAYSDELNAGDAPPPGYDRPVIENMLKAEYVMQELGYADKGRERTGDSVEDCGFIDLLFGYAHLFGDDGLSHFIDISRTGNYPDESKDITRDYLSAKNFRLTGDVKTYALFYAIVKIHYNEWLAYETKRMGEISLEQYEFHNAEFGRADCLHLLRARWLDACKDPLIQKDLRDALIKSCQDNYRRLGTTPPGKKSLLDQLKVLAGDDSSGRPIWSDAIWFAKVITGSGQLKRDQHGNPYLCTNTQAHMLFSAEFKRYVTRRLLEKGHSLDSSTYREVLDLLDAQAPDEKVDFHRRYGFSDKIPLLINPRWISNQKIKITPPHWDIVQTNDVLFLESESEQALPYITKETKPIPWQQLFIRHTPGLPKSKWILVLAWLLFSMRSTRNSSFVILLLRGVEGASKTSIALVLQRFLDPSSKGVQAMPSTRENLAITAYDSYLSVLDNVESIVGALSNFVCGMCTGIVFPKRRLHTDNSLIYIDPTGPLIFTAIPNPFHTPEAQSRALYIPVSKVVLPEGTPEPTTDELADALEEDAPGLYVTLLDLKAKVMEVEKTIHVSRTTYRNKAYVRTLVALANVVGDDRSMIDLIEENSAATRRDALEGQPALEALIAIARARGPNNPLVATMSEFMSAARRWHEHHVDRIPVGKRSEWPETGKAMGDLIKGYQRALIDEDTTVEFHSRGAGKLFALVCTDESVIATNVYAGGKNHHYDNWDELEEIDDSDNVVSISKARDQSN